MSDLLRRGSATTTETTLPDNTNKTIKRARALTLPLQSPQKVGIRRIRQQTLDQSESALLQLPAEIRSQIYRLVLGAKCLAHDVSSRRVGDTSDPWPFWENPGLVRRGLRPWGWTPPADEKHWGNSIKALGLALLLTCRQVYSEAIDTLYKDNIFYFRNPFTNWGMNSWAKLVLPHRLEQIRILILDETIGDPAIMFEKRRQWEKVWRIVAKMTRLRVLYLVVDSLYPKAWTVDKEQRLFGPLEGVSQVGEMVVIVKWKKPERQADCVIPNVPIASLGRVEDYITADEFCKSFPAAKLRSWITDKLKALEAGDRL